VNRESPPSLPAPAFERPTFEQVYASVRRCLGVNVDAEDLVQEVVMIAYRGLEHFHPSTAHGAKPSDLAATLRAWILGIAWRHVSKRQRQVLRRSTVQLDSVMVGEPVEEGPSGEDIATAAERRGILAAVLAKLKPARAEVLIMHTVLEMSAPDIARNLGVNENTVKSRINRARCDALRAIERLPREHRSALQDLDEPRRGAK
jgi:RNA polymerase sigma factor (sigma-70 family)